MKEEMQTSDWRVDSSIISSAARVSNVVEQFREHTDDVRSRILDPRIGTAEERQQFEKPLNHHLRFHNRLEELGARPLGLYPSLGRSAEIRPIR